LDVFTGVVVGVFEPTCKSSQEAASAMCSGPSKPTLLRLCH